MRKVSVIIATYNRAAYLPQALESILGQTVAPDEVIVVNDGSSDGTKVALQPFDGRIVYLEKENGGKASALNMAMPVVSGDYVWIFDDDDIAEPSALGLLLGALEAHPDAGFSFGSFRHLFAGPDGHERYGRTIEFSCTPERIFPELLLDCSIAQQGMLVRRVCYEEVGPFADDLLRCQDYDMLLRLARRFDAIGVGGPLFRMRVHEGARGSAADSHRASERNARWLAYEQIIFGRLYEDLTLAEYLGRDVADSGERLALAQHRHALLRRAAMMGRRGLWHQAIGDLATATQIASDAPRLVDEERRLCSMIAGVALPSLQLIEQSDLLSDLRAALSGRGGRETKLHMARGLHHAAFQARRNSDRRGAARLELAALRVLGAAGFVEALRYFANMR